ncbi:hypothetical protein N7495_004699 [Penicillium taxi]|uniref:uncharacterized protein n=1 Tax=Penicillium taxi TaxID=168475 RepID=UPI002544E023|nr:uncharacterized protein N7495_004699 [Penicillium taxi]KAJ5899955.1 hypothetical protein N7495_004699 [Penicillium taxi]
MASREHACITAQLFCPSKMRETSLFTYSLLLITSTAAVLGLSIPLTFHQHLPLLPSNQQPIMDKSIPDIPKPQPFTAKEDLSGHADGPIISDVLPKTKAINIFARLTRDFEPIASHLNDASKNITVLAPRNSAVEALPYKPWEVADDYARGGVRVYEGQEGHDRIKQNLQRFVEAHLIPVSPWKEGEEVETLAGKKLKWVKEGDKVFVSVLSARLNCPPTDTDCFQIQPGNIEVDSIAVKVSNGEVWVVNSVIT